VVHQLFDQLALLFQSILLAVERLSDIDTVLVELEDVAGGGARIVGMEQAETRKGVRAPTPTNLRPLRIHILGSITACDLQHALLHQPAELLSPFHPLSFPVY